jgi:hypothetical protein
MVIDERQPIDATPGQTALSPRLVVNRSDRNDSVSLVDIPSMINVYDRDRPRLVVDPVDDPVAAAASAVPVVQWWKEAPAYPVRIVQHWSVDELERSGAD